MSFCRLKLFKASSVFPHVMVEQEQGVKQVFQWTNKSLNSRKKRLFKAQKIFQFSDIFFLHGSLRNWPKRKVNVNDTRTVLRKPLGFIHSLLLKESKNSTIAYNRLVKIGNSFKIVCDEQFVLIKILLHKIQAKNTLAWSYQPNGDLQMVFKKIEIVLQPKIRPKHC